jgi:AcrR family transcriptional regulator
VSTTASFLGRPVGASGEETRRRILEAAMQCVAEVGYSRATIREIARKAQMTSGSLYHYFPNKTELIQATFDEMVERSIPRMARAAEGDGDFRNRLMAVLNECDQMMREYPLLAAFDRAIRVGSARHLAENRNSLFSSLRTVVLDIIAQAQQEGALQGGVEADSAANAIFILLGGLADYAATATPEEHHATVEALKHLVAGTLFT